MLKHGDIDLDTGRIFWGYNKGRAEYCAPDKFRARTEKKNARARRRVNRRRYWLNKYKEHRGCFRCYHAGRHYKWPAAVLAFHHIYDWEKSFTVSDNIKKPLRVLMHEISKCEVLCHNCHALEH